MTVSQFLHMNIGKCNMRKYEIYVTLVSVTNVLEGLLSHCTPVILETKFHEGVNESQE